MYENKEFYRLFMAQFLHGHFSHIFGNSLAIFILAPSIEHGYGWLHLTIIYLGAGVSGNALSNLTLHPDGVSIGASTSIFGLMGKNLFIILQFLLLKAF